MDKSYVPDSHLSFWLILELKASCVSMKPVNNIMFFAFVRLPEEHALSRETYEDSRELKSVVGQYHFRPENYRDFL